MERVARYPSPTDHRGEVPNRLAVGAVRAPAAVAGRLAGSGHHGIVVLRVDDVPEETRDDPQMINQRWDGGASWKPPVPGRPLPRYERSIIEGRSGNHFISEAQPYLESSARHHAHRHHWHRHSNEPRWYRGGPHSTNLSSYESMDRPRHGAGGMVPVSSHEEETRHRQHRSSSYGSTTSASTYTTVVSSTRQPHGYPSGSILNRESARLPSSHRPSMHSSMVVIPKNIVIPKAIAPGPPESMVIDSAASTSPTEQSLTAKRSSDSSESSPRQVKRTKISCSPDTARLEGRFDKLDLLCSATLELGPLQDNPTGCSCPKSKCIALYCDCFKAGRRCNPSACTCLNCKNTLAESGADGARSKAIQSILARNPRAFTNAGGNPVAGKLLPGEQACNCIRSRCLKLYCTCFQVGKACNPTTCSCVGCLNTQNDAGGHRQAAIEATLEKRPDAFDKPKVKEIGSGCACKNNRCIRKYCECFRTKLACTNKCSCRECENQESTSADSLSALKKKEQQNDEEPRDASSTPPPIAQL